MVSSPFRDSKPEASWTNSIEGVQSSVKGKLNEQRLHQHSVMEKQQEPRGEHQGVHPRAIMELLGHSSITVTMNVYGHVMPAMMRDAADKMDAIIGS